MTRAQIVQQDGQIGFYWTDESGVPAHLIELTMAEDAEPERLLPTHLEALDDALIDAAGRWGEILGGGRPPASPQELLDVRELVRTLDRLTYEYGEAVDSTGLPPEMRAGQIIGTASVFAIRARAAIGSAGPTPFEGELDDPEVGVVAGFGEMHQVNPAEPWRGGRWLVRTDAGQRFPATLSMFLFDSSGVNKDASLEEHRAALRSVVEASRSPASDARVAAGAIDWLLYDWLMAHRDGPDSAAIEIRSGRVDDAAMIVDAAAAAVRARAGLDPDLLSFAAQGG